MAFVCSAVLSGGRGDWNYFVDLGRALLVVDGFDFYRVNDAAQTGPLSLIAAAALSETPRNGFVAAVALAAIIGFATLVVTERRTLADRGPSETRGVMTLLGGIVLALWWGQLGSFGHLDDAAALGLAVLALHSHTAGQTRRAGVAVGLAIAFKPWAVFFLPFALNRERRSDRVATRWESSVGLVLAGGFAAAMWLPFVISEPSSLRHLSPTVQLADDSTLAVLGFESLDTSIGLRVSQLLIGLAVAYAFTIFGRPHAALPAAIAARMLVDPGTWNYYTSGLILACIVWQLRNRDAILPWLALMASLGLRTAHFIDDTTVRGIVRMMTLAGVLVAVTVSSQREPGWAPIDQGP